MAVSLKHKFTSPKGDGADPSFVQPSNWNDEHDLLLGGSKLVGRAEASAGAAEEITVGTGLNLDNATKTLSAPPVTIATNRLVGRTTAGVGAEETIEVGVGLLLADQKLSNVGFLPVGSITDFAGAVAPDGWALCYGQELSRVTYADLAAVCLEIYGAYTDGAGAAGATHFRVPDFRGRVGAGKDNMGGTAADRITNTGDGHPSLNGKTLGAAGGSDRNTLTIPQLPAHGHPYRTSSDTGDIDGGNAGLVKSDSGTTQAAHSGPVSASAGELIGGSGEGKPHPNLQPTIIINKIIFTGVYPAP